MMRGTVVVSVLSLLIAPAVPSFGAAPGYPEKPVTIVAPFAPGAADTVARLLAQHIGTALDQRFIVENRAGASGEIGAVYVKRAKPDGYTVLYGTASGMSVNPQIRKVDYDPRRDFTNIALIGVAPYVIGVNASLGIGSVAELIKYAKSNPGPLKLGNAGTGSLSDLAAVLFGQRAGLDVLSVPFKGTGPAATAMQGGETQALIASYVSFIAGMQAGRARVLAVAASERLEIAPDVPTAEEAGLRDFDVSQWWGLYGPAGVPRPVVEKLNAAMNEVLRGDEVKKRLSALAVRPVTGSPDDLTAYLEKEYRKWGDVIRAQKAAQKPQ
ncbi:MAG: tripartite tricarboxylate transporter substrate binding protein [Burkholderiales bacterium]|nr:tripartite tricarboxylate transporter substrate binding protein [Burkholderiales bacterium]